MAFQRLVLRHGTTYRYPRPVALGPHTVRLHPAPYAHAPVLAYAMAVDPPPLTLHWYYDALANRVARASWPGAVEILHVEVTLTTELGEFNPFDFMLDADTATWPFDYPPVLQAELAPYRATGPVRPWFADLLATLPRGPVGTVDLLIALNQQVSNRIGYVTRMEPGVQDPAYTIEHGTGSCRDVAWLLVHAARQLGFAARFVSGYLVQLHDPAIPDSVAADGVELHAWAEMFLPGAGWIGFDATSGLVAGAGHIALASGADPATAAPISGTADDSSAEMTAIMRVERLPA